VDEVNSDVDEVHPDQLGERTDSDPTFVQSGPSSKGRFLAEADLNDLVRVFNLSKIQAEILASKFKGWNLRQHETKTWYFRYRQNESMHFFTQENSLVLVMMLVLLWSPLDIYTLQEWTLFDDSSELNLKALLLLNGNEYPAVPSAHAVYVMSHKTTCNFSLQVLAMKNIPGIFAGTYFACNLDIGNTAVFVRMVRQGHKNDHIKERITVSRKENCNV